MILNLKEARLQKSVLTNRNLILRLVELGKQPHHCKAQRIPKAQLVDQVDIGGKNRCLPREISELVDSTEKSAEVIVPRVTS